jgi:hypothetical protein
MRVNVSVSAGLALLGAVATASAQTVGRTVAEQKQSRYQIGVMERVLEGAVEHGVTTIRDQLQTIGPTEMLISENARARGFRLEGYGVFFDVLVPSFNTSTLWATQTLDRNDLGLESALRTLQAHVRGDADPNLQQALKRIELQIAPYAALGDSAARPGGQARNASGSAAATTADTVDAPPAAGTPAATATAAAMSQPAPAPLPSLAANNAAESVLTDPDAAYRKEVVEALMDAMLDHSSALGIGASEWLTVAARRNDERPRLAPADTDARTFVIRLKGADLAAFLARQISKEEALQRFEVRVF